MNLEQLRAKRAEILRAADALRVDGGFPTDEARGAFDAKMGEIDQVDTQIRALEQAKPPATPPTPADVVAAREAGMVAERQRGHDIREAVRIAKIEPSVAADMIARGVTIDVARSEVFAKLASEQEKTPVNSHIRMGEDAKDKWVRGAEAWLLVRSGLAALVAQHTKAKEGEFEPGEFRGMTLLDLAKDALDRNRVSYRGLDRMDVASLAFRGASYQTTSDFAVLLENVMHKILRAAYGLTPDTWSRWCGTETVTDFRTHNWYRLGSLTELDGLNEHGEFLNKAIPDAEKATFSVGTKGNIIAITRQTIVNDDLGGMTRLTAMLGRAGKLTIEKQVYALLALNGGLGPNQSDGQPLFHANRANIGPAAAIGVEAIDADRVVMAQQMDVNKVDFTDLRPDVLLVPIGLGGTARVINNAEYDVTVSNKFQVPNKVRGLFRDIVDTPRVSGTRRYLFADRSMSPIFVVSFLEGVQEPVLETRDGWRTDGVEMRARLDFGVDAVDHRGAVTNAGV